MRLCKDCEVVKLPCHCEFTCRGESAHESIHHTYKEGCFEYAEPLTCIVCHREFSRQGYDPYRLIEHQKFCLRESRMRESQAFWRRLEEQGRMLGSLALEMLQRRTEEFKRRMRFF